MIRANKMNRKLPRKQTGNVVNEKSDAKTSIKKKYEELCNVQKPCTLNTFVEAQKKNRNRIEWEMRKYCKKVERVEKSCAKVFAIVCSFVNV